MAASIPMIAMTTSSSMSVKPLVFAVGFWWRCMLNLLCGYELFVLLLVLGGPFAWKIMMGRGVVLSAAVMRP